MEDDARITALLQAIRELHQEIEHAEGADAETRRHVLSMARVRLATLEVPDSLPETIREGVNRAHRHLAELALALYREGGCDDLDEAARQAYLDEHAEPLTVIAGIGPTLARRLFLHGLVSHEQLETVDEATLARVPGLNAGHRARILRALGPGETD
ncbi:helix-hairpin-helix domain-containing protein [Halomonas sp. 328]|uniref:helix-hairpin-helix domain-containing protein n=1 Tax=Halomonas sp. 328 TaxID=2776704 RepID=UPI0018A716F9|nr:helix-hairpin-helix domain-containing protein [Halomonas sp. 328]MBF8222136.1 hypothetical protein [Halomonas sp. 328]